MGHNVYPGLDFDDWAGVLRCLIVGIILLATNNAIIVVNNWKLKKLGYTMPGTEKHSDTHISSNRSSMVSERLDQESPLA